MRQHVDENRGSCPPDGFGFERRDDETSAQGWGRWSAIILAAIDLRLTRCLTLAWRGVPREHQRPKRNDLGRPAES
jgi:hypothetical protein